MARRGKGGIGGGILSIIVIVMVVAVLFSIAKINNIQSPGDLIDFFKSKSDETSECASGSGWTCNPFAPDDNGGDSGDSGKNDSGDSGDESVDKAKPATSYLKTLESIPTVESQEIDYDRGGWKHWTGSPCNTREEIVKSSGEDVKTDDECRAQSGTWLDPFTGKEYTDSSQMDLDHVLPLRYAASHGGFKWDEDRKTEFANDKVHLLLVGASPNRAKGAKGPSEWMPDDKSFHCDYAKIWVDTADKYSDSNFGLAKADKESLAKTLESCG